ncbi:hypothetical protein V1512DRAFT_268161 [Lipomyces arxii]|uniref:uncharacterized protein n=1 Tax=Lipomyces arxii TaxID=56418 RepID=UPI0034CD850D
MADDSVKYLRQLMLDTVNHLAGLRTSKRGRYYSELFMIEPDSDEYPEYYQIIQHPMAIETVKQNIIDGKYSNFDSFESDVRLIFQNAKIFNEEFSQVYADADHLEHAFESRQIKLKQKYEDAFGPIQTKKRKAPEDAPQHSKSVKLKLSLKEPEERPSKIKLSLGKPKAPPESEPEPEQEQEPKLEQTLEPEHKEERVVVKRPRGRPPRTAPKPEEYRNSPAKEDVKQESVPNSAPSTPIPSAAADPTAADPSWSSSAINPASVSSLPVVVPSPNDIKTAEESRLRGLDKTIEDALITHFAITSTPSQQPNSPYSISFPPHSTEVFQSFTLTLPPTYSVITISPTLSHSLLTRHYNLYMSLNNRRLSPTIMPGNGIRKLNEAPKSFYEVKLNPGVNMVECLVHASPPPPAGLGVRAGRVVAPKKYGLVGGVNTTVNSEGSEKERIVVWVLVQR